MAPTTVRWRYAIFVVVAAALAGLAFWETKNTYNDWVFFEVGARTMVHYRGSPLYSDPPLHLYEDNAALQVGPPAILLVAAAEFLKPLMVKVVITTLMCVMGVLSIGAIERTGGFVAASGRAAVTSPKMLVATVPVASVWALECALWSHVDDALALSLTALAAVLVARQRSWWAVGLLLGTATAAKPWALILTPIIVGLSRPDRARAALVCITTAALWWAPFVIAAPGTVQALGHVPNVPSPGSVLFLLGFRGDTQAWIRPTQFAVGLAVGVWVATRSSWTAAPLAALAMRVLLDPFAWPYYGLGPLLFALLWDICRWHEVPIPRYTVAVLAFEFVVPTLLPDQVAGAGRLLWSAGTLAALLAPTVRRGVRGSEPRIGDTTGIAVS